MKTDALTIAIAALAVATETRGENSDEAIAIILDPLPDECAPALVACLRAFQAQHDQGGGVEALQRAGLALARRACGLQP